MRKLLLLTSFLFTLTFYAQNNTNFSLAANEVNCLCPEAEFGDTGTLTINGEAEILTKRTEAELRDLAIIDKDDPQITLTCTSGITDMYSLFRDKGDFNQNISSWDVSLVTDMSNMFYNATLFNQPLNNWDVSGVIKIYTMFYFAESFNQPLDSWDVSNAPNMSNMFSNATSFNQPLDSWDVGQVTNMGYMFESASSFNQPINSWDVSQVNNMKGMFRNTLAFNQDLSGWCVEQMPDEPTEFAFNSALQNNFFPNWGAECNLSTTNPEAIGFNILIYPNPSNSKAFIENGGQIILSKIKLIDMLGRDIKTFSASQITNGFDVSGVDAGNYFVQFTTVDNRQFIKRLIVK